MEGNQLECNPWSNIFLKTRKSDMCSRLMYIPLQATEQIENERALKKDEK